MQNRGSPAELVHQLFCPLVMVHSSVGVRSEHICAECVNELREFILHQAVLPELFHLLKRQRDCLLPHKRILVCGDVQCDHMSSLSDGVKGSQFHIPEESVAPLEDVQPLVKTLQAEHAKNASPDILHCPHALQRSLDHHRQRQRVHHIGLEDRHIGLLFGFCSCRQGLSQIFVVHSLPVCVRVVRVLDGREENRFVLHSPQVHFLKVVVVGRGGVFLQSFKHLLNLSFSLYSIEVPDNVEERVLRPVVRGVKLLDIF
mmetsp:Transcript_17012/g.34514  ORF Transcript_17012/g.34514 Transcript_17012/m.34514 type:complete len:258 (-) Transcript_17012:948-1721(-)